MMRINWIGYYYQNDGYGRFSSRMVQALRKAGVTVKSATMDHVAMPSWMQEHEEIDWSALTISFLPPYYLQPVPGRQWLYSMTEGSSIPQSWVDNINRCGVERVIVPCQHNADSFRNSGVLVPISVVPGGTDPVEFPFRVREQHRPYTFFTLADRGSRKGWEEVWEAFYSAFGGKTTGNQDVRLIIKARPKKEPTLPILMSQAKGADKRILWQITDAGDMGDIYTQADCVVLPSRSEGWGMPHREAASLGIPVITQKHSGLDDGHLEEWALVVHGGALKPIPKDVATSLGEWMVADVSALADMMRMVYRYPVTAQVQGERGARWLQQNQTWGHSAARLLSLIGEN